MVFGIGLNGLDGLGLVVFGIGLNGLNGLVLVVLSALAVNASTYSLQYISETNKNCAPRAPF